jgi:FkbM family methyltransferase
MKNPAPIILFVYNRLWHTQQTVEALQNNELAAKSDLYIYADGAKTEIDPKVEEVRAYIRSIGGFKSVSIIEREKNWGLADNIIDGVTNIVNKYGKIIVLEDDIITSRGFLRYMNDALQVYENEEKVMHVSGYMFPVKRKMPATFFYNTASCWGWATWARAWKYYNNDAKYLLDELYNNNQEITFDLNGAYKFTDQLISNIGGNIKTWAVKWYASFFLQNGLALHPYPSLTNNIGFDGSGVHCGENSNSPFFWPRLAKNIKVEKAASYDDRYARKAVEQFYRSINSRKSRPLKSMLKQFIPPVFINTKNKFKNPEINHLERIKNIPRFKPFSTTLFGNIVTAPDSASYLFMFDEIFEKEIYRFNTSSKVPLIIDAGANIGLSVVYYKKLYPTARIVAFEPDEKIFKHLANNVKAFGLTDVLLIQKALWKEETELSFYSEGADGGRIHSEASTVRVKTDILSNYLQEEVDFLKIDIEGAELEVLLESKKLLKNVKNIFVEYHSLINERQKLSEILSLLERHDFRYFINAPGLQSAQSFIKVNNYNGMDMQLNIYGINRIVNQRD